MINVAARTRWHRSASMLYMFFAFLKNLEGFCVYISNIQTVGAQFMQMD